MPTVGRVWTPLCCTLGQKYRTIEEELALFFFFFSLILSSRFGSIPNLSFFAFPNTFFPALLCYSHHYCHSLSPSFVQTLSHPLTLSLSISNRR